MTFASRARAAQQLRKGGTCSVRAMLASLDPAYRTEVETALADQSIYASVISAVLAEDGHEITPETLNRHRHGRCKCDKA